MVRFLRDDVRGTLMPLRLSCFHLFVLVHLLSDVTIVLCSWWCVNDKIATAKRIPNVDDTGIHNEHTAPGACERAMKGECVVCSSISAIANIRWMNEYNEPQIFNELQQYQRSIFSSGWWRLLSASSHALLLFFCMFAISTLSSTAVAILPLCVPALHAFTFSKFLHLSAPHLTWAHVPTHTYSTLECDSATQIADVFYIRCVQY